MLTFKLKLTILHLSRRFNNLEIKNLKILTTFADNEKNQSTYFISHINS
jgi:hypothetical protein